MTPTIMQWRARADGPAAPWHDGFAPLLVPVETRNVYVDDPKKPPALQVGLVKYHNGKFEVILTNTETFHEVTLTGTCEIDIDTLDKVCPTCVMTPTEGRRYHGVRRELNELRAAISNKGGDEHSPTQWAYDTLAKANERRRNEINVYRLALELISRHEDYQDGMSSVGDRPVHTAEESAQMATNALQTGNALVIEYKRSINKQFGALSNESDKLPSEDRSVDAEVFHPTDRPGQDRKR